jgi:hypothetical protein
MATPGAAANDRDVDDPEQLAGKRPHLAMEIGFAPASAPSRSKMD